MKKFTSKVGLEFIIPIFGIVLFALSMSIIDKTWTLTGIMCILILLILHLFLTTEYTINKENLNIKSSFLINKNININSIKKLTETNNLISSPAISIDRIEIVYNKYDTILVSPKDKTGFIQSLIDINKNIDVKLRAKKTS